MLKLHNISKIYHSEGIQTVALRSVNIEIAKGEFVAIMGPSGCGKSTLLNIMGMLDKPTNGRYEFSQQDITALKEKQLANLRKHNIGFIFQNFNLLDELSVEENVGLALLYQSHTRKQRQFKISEVLDKVSMSHRARHYPSQLSGGQQQRIAVARAIVGRQKLILADEPTGNLDSIHGQDIMQLLQNLNDHGSTIVMVTHSHSHADYARRTINLFDGSIVNERLRAIS